PGPNEPKGFILTTALGIAGAFVATFIGQTVGWYRLDQGAGLIGGALGAPTGVFIWNKRRGYRLFSGPGQPQRAITSPLAVGAKFEGAASDINTRRQTWDWRISLPV